MLKDDIKILSEQVERLVIENKLLRAASEEQRELNGKLRTEIKYRLLMKAALEERADINIRNIDMEISGNDELQECINNLQESIADGTYMNIMDCICCSDTLQIDSGIESVLDSLGVVRYQVP